MFTRPTVFRSMLTAGLVAVAVTGCGQMRPSQKIDIYEATLSDDRGRGAQVLADGNVHFRASLDPAGVWMHILSRCRLGQIPLKAGDRIAAEFTLRLLTGGRP